MPNITLNPIPTAIRVTLGANTEVSYRNGSTYEFSITETSGTTFDFVNIDFLSDYRNVRGLTASGVYVTFPPGANLSLSIATSAGTLIIAY